MRQRSLGPGGIQMRRRIILAQPFAQQKQIELFDTGEPAGHGAAGLPAAAHIGHPFCQPGSRGLKQGFPLSRQRLLTAG